MHVLSLLFSMAEVLQYVLKIAIGIGIGNVSIE